MRCSPSVPSVLILHQRKGKDLLLTAVQSGAVAAPPLRAGPCLRGFPQMFEHNSNFSDLTVAAGDGSHNLVGVTRQGYRVDHVTCAVYWFVPFNLHWGSRTAFDFIWL